MSYSIKLLEASVSQEERIILLKSPLCRHLKNAGNQPQKSLFYLTVNEVEFRGHISRIIMFSRDYPKSKQDWLTEQAAFLFCVFQRSGGKHEANARQRRGQRERGAPLLACIYPPPPLPFPLAFASRMALTPQQRNRNFSNYRKSMINDLKPRGGSFRCISHSN